MTLKSPLCLHPRKKCSYTPLYSVNFDIQYFFHITTNNGNIQGGHPVHMDFYSNEFINIYKNI